MGFSSETLLRDLDQSQIIDWSVELNCRKEAFEFLIHAVRSYTLNSNQFLNAMHMLYRMAFPEYATRVLQALVELSAHDDVRLRSEAVQLVIGLVRVSQNLKRALQLSEEQEAAIWLSVERGLTPKVADLASRYFTK